MYHMVFIRSALYKILSIVVFSIFAAYAVPNDQMIIPLNDVLPEEFTYLKKTNREATAFNYTVKKRLINGRKNNRVNLVHVGDGYAVTDTNQFYAHADSNMAYFRGLSSIVNNKMAMRPIPRYDKFLNWYQINVISPNTGIPGALGGVKDSDRMSWVNATLANDLFKQVQTKLGVIFHWKTSITNIAGYYNSGGAIANFSRENWGDIAVHEQGHSFFKFVDEYYGSGSDTREYDELNSTAKIGSSKWSSWVGYKDIDPRTRSGGGTPTGDTVGYYLGSRYVSSGQYRPTSNSKMNMTGQRTPTSFNAPCREAIIRTIYSLVKPIDTMTSNTTTLNNPDSVWVKVIDPNVLKVDWFVNGVLKKASSGTSIKKAEIASISGMYTVRAHVYDEIIRHSFSNNKSPDTLDLVRGDTAKMFQDVQWTVNLTSVTVSKNIFEKNVYSLSCNKNSIVYSLESAGMVSFELVKPNGAIVKSYVLNGQKGRNDVRLFGVNELSAGIYYLKMIKSNYNHTIPITIQ